MKKLIAILTATLGLIPSAALAQATTFSIESIGEQIGVGGADLKQTVINVIQWVLGIMALVAVAMIIFSGFIAATSPDQDRADRAQRTILGAVIGLVIILLAWAIVLFVARTTAEVTV
ncbi:MAG: hypothetical protein HYY50_00030 [Candidatus Kerfeldbacteria bacterium]|nr:hypothetical protein [Candidatus Kerfeldbacteria bacterium]